ncbi:DMT family transporter [Pseudoruegeria sp. SK021]|uniref:DMT family transporter n=1 Tax=Pseudoruegeria sp. SK021 TaxID=1933035 RepID=UPI000A2578AD|nr:DMT family transporter [Pseudoruegeria sp. SK021]OSP55550.1 EamA family transporter [Pseudoruegeria sp. SK021]
MEHSRQSVGFSPVLKAAFWMAGTITAFCFMAISGRMVGNALDTFEIMAYRSLLGIGIVVAVGAFSGKLHQVKVNRLPLHLVRNISHFTGQNLWFFALTVIPLAQLIALEFTYPIWVTILAPFFLHERLTRMRALAAVVGFIGILIVVRPGMTTLNVGTIAALFCALGFAGSAMATRKLTEDQSILCILFWLAVMQAVLGLICAGIDGDIALPSLAVVPWLIVIGCSGLTAHFCLTNALALAPATIVTPMDFARLPVLAVVGAVFYGEALDPFLFLGGAIIFAAIYTILVSPSAPKPPKPL